ncbi:unnamed protein product, partial [Dibothriocephalus latus]
PQTPEPSPHEITAVKAYKQLAGGAEVDTDVIVDLILDKIREIPSGVGWFLDGFPSTVEHARVLEQKLNALLHKPGEVSFPTSPRISGSLPLPEQIPKFQGLDFIIVLQENDSDLIERFLDIIKGSNLSSKSESLGKDHEEGGETSKVTSDVPHMDLNLSSLHAKIVNFEEQLPRIESFYRKHSECCAFHHLSTPEGQLQPELSKREQELCLTLSNGKDLPAGCAAAYVAVYHLLEDHLKNNMEASVIEEVSEDAAKSDLSVQDQPNSRMKQAVNPVDEENKNALNAADKEAVTDAPPLPEPPADDLQKPEDAKDHSQPPPIPTIPVANAEASGALSTGASNLSEADCAYVGVNPSKEVASILSNLWIQSETVYNENIRLICRLLRQQRETIIRHVYDCRNDLAVFVRRPDDMQALVTEFQMVRLSFCTCYYTGVNLLSQQGCSHSTVLKNAHVLRMAKVVASKQSLCLDHRSHPAKSRSAEKHRRHLWRKGEPCIAMQFSASVDCVHSRLDERGEEAAAASICLWSKFMCCPLSCSGCRL